MPTSHQIRELLEKEKIKGLELLFHQYHQTVFKTAYYLLKDEEEAKDIVQELFAKMWVQHEQLLTVDNYKSYLNTAAKNMALDAIEKNVNTESNKQNYIQLEWDPAQPFEKELEDPERLKAEIERFVSGLPPKCRLIFSLSRFEGLTNVEIADYLDLSSRTVEKQISIALKLLRKEAGSRSDKLLSIMLSLVAI